MTVRKCDRCEKEIPGDIFTSVDITTSRIMFFGKSFELCNDCRGELVKFLNSEEWLVGERKERLEKEIENHKNWLGGVCLSNGF